MSLLSKSWSSRFELSYIKYPPGLTSFMSCAILWALTQTNRSIPALRPKYPFSLIRTSYQVGSPWMLEGKMFLGLTGMPIRKIALANKKFALADPVPLTLANRTTKSFILGFFLLLKLSAFINPLLLLHYRKIFAYPRQTLGTVPHTSHNADKHLHLLP